MFYVFMSHIWHSKPGPLTTIDLLWSSALSTYCPPSLTKAVCFCFTVRTTLLCGKNHAWWQWTALTTVDLDKCQSLDSIQMAWQYNQSLKNGVQIQDTSYIFVKIQVGFISMVKKYIIPNICCWTHLAMLIYTLYEFRLVLYNPV